MDVLKFPTTKFVKTADSISIGGLYQNPSSVNTLPENIACHSGLNKPLINRLVLSKKYTIFDEAGNLYWSKEIKTKNLKQYPYEKFIMNNYKNIGKGESLIIEDEDGLSDLVQDEEVLKKLFKKYDR
jgi:hypothetical protein